MSFERESILEVQYLSFKAQMNQPFANFHKGKSFRPSISQWMKFSCDNGKNLQALLPKLTLNYTRSPLECWRKAICCSHCTTANVVAEGCFQHSWRRRGCHRLPELSPITIPCSLSLCAGGSFCKEMFPPWG